MSDILAMLVAQAEGRSVDYVTLRALVEEAAEVGARRALAIATPTRSAKTTKIGLVRRMVARVRRTSPRLQRDTGNDG